MRNDDSRGSLTGFGKHFWTVIKTWCSDLFTFKFQIQNSIKIGRACLDITITKHDSCHCCNVLSHYTLQKKFNIICRAFLFLRSCIIFRCSVFGVSSMLMKRIFVGTYFNVIWKKFVTADFYKAELCLPYERYRQI